MATKATEQVYTFWFEIHDHVSDRVKRGQWVTYKAATHALALQEFYNDKTDEVIYIKEMGYLEEYGELKHEEIATMTNQQIIDSFYKLDIGSIVILVVKP